MNLGRNVKLGWNALSKNCGVERRSSGRHPRSQTRLAAAERPGNR